MTDARDIARNVLDEHGMTYCEELGIHIASNTPSALFKTLVFALLASARISHSSALRATRALFDAGWTTARRMYETSWQERVTVLNRNGYARYDESTSRYLAYDCELIMDKYGGDLRRLRETASRDVEEERRLLIEFKGIGEVGVSIFFREAQVAWQELYPFADKFAIEQAKKMNLGTSARDLARLVEPDEFPRLVAGIVRLRFEKK